jgi:proline iminopeptidase
MRFELFGKFPERVMIRRFCLEAALALSIVFTLAAQDQVEEGYKIVNGTRLYFKIVGEGTPVVVVHGGPAMDHSYLLPQMARLGKGYKLIFYDQRAMGRSSVDVDTSSMTMDNFVEDLEGIRKAFNLGTMNLFGHSWGGLVSMFYAVKYPDHLRTLILCNTTAASSALRDRSFALMSQGTATEDSLAQAEVVQTDGFKRREAKTMEKFFRLLFRGSFYDKRYADSLTLAFDSTYATKSAMQRHLFLDPQIHSYDLHEALDTIQCPTLIVAGADDRVAPETNEMIQEHIPGSRYVLLPNCGHFPFIEAPEEFFPVIREFLQKNAR